MFNRHHVSSGSVNNVQKSQSIFLGKAFQWFLSKKSVEFGWNGNIYSSAVFVMHFPVRGKASIRTTELKEVLTASL